MGKHYVILTAGGGINGVFDGIADFDRVTANYNFIGWSLAYGVNDVSLGLARNGLTFATFGQTDNQKAVAANIESLGRGNILYDTVTVSTPADNLPSFFTATSSDIHASVRGILVEDDHFVRDAAVNRVRDAFGNVSNQEEMPPMSSSPETMTTTVSSWGTIYGSWSHIGNYDNAVGRDHSIGGFVTGIDGLITENWRVGLLAGYADSSLAGPGSSATVQSYQIGLYGGAKWDARGLRLGASFSHHEIDTKRSVDFFGREERNKAAYDANSLQLFSEAGYEFNTRFAILEPFAGIAYTYLKAHSFTENGGFTALSGLFGSMGSTTTTLGLHAAHQFNIGAAKILTVKAMAAWRHAFGNITPQARLAFAGRPPFSVNGACQFPRMYWHWRQDSMSISPETLLLSYPIVVRSLKRLQRI